VTFANLLSEVDDEPASPILPKQDEFIEQLARSLLVSVFQVSAQYQKAGLHIDV
jgi:hypothetical protein